MSKRKSASSGDGRTLPSLFDVWKRKGPRSPEDPIYYWKWWTGVADAEVEHTRRLASSFPITGSRNIKEPVISFFDGAVVGELTENR